jgi:hypothetical protein
VVAAVTIGSGRAAAQTDALYHLGPDSEPQAGVPQGTVTEWEKLPSQAYPGTLHDFCVYVPAQYDPATPAALMIFQDGQAWLRLTGDYRVPYVFDNLIYRREMPVTIAVFINPGRTPEQPEASAADWGDRSTNRPQEYNALDDKYARVITDELMPVLYKRYNLSRDRLTTRSEGPVQAPSRPSRLRGIGPTSSESAEHDRQLHQHQGRPRVPGPDPRQRSQADSDLPAGRPERQSRRARRGRGGDLCGGPRLARPEHQDGRRAHRKGVRRQLHLGDRHALQQAGRRDPSRHASLALA